MMKVPLCVCREAEPTPECHLKDLLQQLNTIIAAKPSEKPNIRQGERRRFPFMCKHLFPWCTLYWFVWSVILPVSTRICSIYVFTDEAEDPACIPIFWISKWVDYSDKYGLGEDCSDFTAVCHMGSKSHYFYTKIHTAGKNKWFSCICQVKKHWYDIICLPLKH